MNAPVAGAPVAVLRRWGRWRGRDWLLGAVPMLLALGLAYLHLTSPPPAISLDTYERIAIGMTRAEVEQLVGARPGGYGPFWGPGERLGKGSAEPVQWVRWGSPDGLLSVGFGEDGRVCGKRLEYHPQVTPAHPERWSAWRRLVERSVPEQEPRAIYSPF